MIPNLWGDTGVSLHCLMAKLAEWPLCFLNGDCPHDYWSQCAIVLNRTHIWDTSSPSSLWTRDGTGRDAGLESRKTCLVSAVLVGLDARLGGISDGFWSSWTDLEIAILIWLQSVCRPGRTGCLLELRRRSQKSAGEWNRRPLITKHCIAGRRRRHPTLFPYSGSFIESCIVSWLQGVKGNIIHVIFTASILLYCMDTAGLHQDRLC